MFLSILPSCGRAKINSTIIFLYFVQGEEIYWSSLRTSPFLLTVNGLAAKFCATLPLNVKDEKSK